MRTYESYILAEVGVFTVRVWRTEPDSECQIDNSYLIERLSALHDSCMFDPSLKPTMRKLADEVADIPRVSAVQVIDTSTSESLVVYVDWPN